MDAIREGIKLAPAVGIGGAFYRWMYSTSAQEWGSRLAKARRHGDCLYGEAYPDPDRCCGPIGSVEFAQRGEFAYAYLVDMRGNWQAITFGLTEVVRP